MSTILDAFWRAAAYCLHPRVILLSLLPLAVVAALAGGLGYVYWKPAVDAVDGAMQSWAVLSTLFGWLQAAGVGDVRGVLAPLVVIVLAVPVIVLVSLLLVSVLMTPAIVKLVAARRFPALERKHGAGWWSSLAWSAGCTVLAFLALVISVPFWLVPPLVLVLPPLIWGWLTYRVLSFDVLAEHASADERRAILRGHRWPLLGMGIVVGYLGAAPSLLWAASAAILVLAPLVILVFVWLYTLVFAFSALWFAHYALSALERLRIDGAAPPAAVSVVDPLPGPEPLQALPMRPR